MRTAFRMTQSPNFYSQLTEIMIPMCNLFKTILSLHNLLLIQSFVTPKWTSKWTWNENYTDPYAPFPSNPFQARIGVGSNLALHVMRLNKKVAYTDRIYKTKQSRQLESYDQIMGLTDEALLFCGETRGLEALDKLGYLSSQRIPFDLSNYKQVTDTTIIGKFPGLFTRTEAGEIVEIVSKLQEHDLLSVNPDSVDGKPSLHLNLVTNGQDIVIEESNELKDAIQDLNSRIISKVYNELLPEARIRMGCDNLKIGEIFLRRYNSDAIDDDNIRCGRSGISAHYDVYSKVTAVIALDDIAKDGQNGLYVMADGASSNHAALRRFVPLQCGDAAIHSWDVLHGVDVKPLDDNCLISLERTSLIVWFITEDDSHDEKVVTSRISPWLQNKSKLEENHINQFVLGSLLEDVSELDVNDESNSFKLYFKSASSENSFALTRLGSLFESKMKSIENDRHFISSCENLLDSLTPKSALPFALKQVTKYQSNNMKIASLFWYEGAKRGNPLAQFALADELMSLCTIMKNNDKYDVKLLATTLFALAAQQRMNEAQNALDRVVQNEIRSGEITNNEDFANSSIVRISQTSCLYV